MPVGPALTVRARNTYLVIFREVKREHGRTLGRRLRGYKKLDKAGLDAAFGRLMSSRRRARPYVAHLLHELVWGQYLPNANHRTAIAFLQQFLAAQGVDFPARGVKKKEFLAAIRGWQLHSKPAVEYRDTSMMRRRKKEHERMTRAWIETQTNGQSLALTKVGSHSLRRFFS